MSPPYGTVTHTDPFRLRLQKGITAVLQSITIANGYKHDMAASVFRGRMRYGDDEPVPMLALIEPPVQFPIGKTTAGATANKLPYEIIIQGFAEDDVAHPTDPAHMLLADVKVALSLEIAKLQGMKTQDVFGVRSNRLCDVTLDGGVVRPSDDISSKAYFWLPLRMNLVENWATPYAD